MKKIKFKTLFTSNKSIHESKNLESLLHSSDHKLHLQPMDYFLILFITLVYAFLAFFHLGSTTAPQTSWNCESINEEIIFVLNNPEDFHLLFYTGRSDADLSVAVSNDGRTWSEDILISDSTYNCYRWYYALQTQSDDPDHHFLPERNKNIRSFHGRYLRLSASNSGETLFEITARTPDGRTLPMSIISQTGQAENASHLIDEQALCPAVPGWYNSTYFDETCYSRSAYEYLHSQPVYEWTHPPLGKLFMAASISAFGMTPFAWRFPGALAGVLMLPTIYLLAMQLTHKRKVAFLSIATFALDLMHLTQTRIATIDSFPVLFILLSYLFMIRFMQTDRFAAPHKDNHTLIDSSFVKTLWPLFMSGLFISLAIACKWIGIYSVAGLAIMYFLSLFNQYSITNTALKTSNAIALTEFEEARIAIAKKYSKKRMLLTCLLCVFFFVLLPLTIYALSYIPMFLAQGSMTFNTFIQKLWNEQLRIFSFHSTPSICATHTYSSKWWQWPFNEKQILYANDAFAPNGFSSSINLTGNPWIFSVGMIGILSVFFTLIYRLIWLKNKISFQPGDDNLSLLIIAISFLSQYLPWVFVPRGTFFYHYFASVPFIILAISFMLGTLTSKLKRNLFSTLHLLISLALFIILFPDSSGITVPINWIIKLFE